MRERHPVIQLQRAYRDRPVRYAMDPEGDLIVHPKGLLSRTDFRREKHELRRLRKLWATMTKGRRNATAAHAARMSALMKLNMEHNVVLHPDNPFVPIQLRRKLRKQGKGKIVKAKSPIKVVKGLVTA